MQRFITLTKPSAVDGVKEKITIGAASIVYIRQSYTGSELYLTSVGAVVVDESPGEILDMIQMDSCLADEEIGAVDHADFPNGWRH